MSLILHRVPQDLCTWPIKSPVPQTPSESSEASSTEGSTGEDDDEEEGWDSGKFNNCCYIFSYAKILHGHFFKMK